MMTVAPVTLVDVTLRDGSHPMRHQFTGDQVRAIVGALDRSGVPVVEVSHGDGLGGSSIQYGRSLLAEGELLATAVGAMEHGQVGALLIPGIGTMVELTAALQQGVRVVRVATHCTEADISAQHLGLVKSRNLTAVGFLMMAHMIEAPELAAQARLMACYGADVVYVADSAGACTPDMVRCRVRAVREAVDCAVGFHGHNNLGLAIANTLVAVEEGASWVDGALAGLGAGAGNAQTEILVAVLEKVGVPTGTDLYTVMDAAEDLVRPIMPRPVTVDRDSLSLGYAGVYSTFLWHARRAAERFGVDTRDILVDLGRRRMVGGQEDMVIDAALALVERSERKETPMAMPAVDRDEK